MLKTNKKVLTLLVVMTLLVSMMLASGNVFALGWYTDLDLENIPQYDFEGKTVYLVKLKGYEEPEEGTEEYEHWQNVEKYFNVDVEMIQLGMRSVDKILERIMGGKPTDIVRFIGNQPAGKGLELIASDALQPLNEVFKGDQWYDKLNLPEFVRYEYNVANTVMKYKGQILGTFSYDRDKAPVGAGATLFWNQDMFEREGVPDIYELVEKGEWTWDAMKDIVRRLTKDTDGDGKLDQFGIGHRLYTRDGLNFLSTNDAYLTKSVDGEIKFTLNDSKAKEVLNYLNSYFEEGLTLYSHPQFDELDHGWPGSEIRQFSEGNLGIMTRNDVAYIQLFQWEDYYEEMEDDWGIAPYPVKEAGDDYIAKPIQGLPTVGIPVTARYEPEKLLTLYYALYPRDPNLHQSFLDQYEMWVRDKKTLEAIEKYFLNVRGDLEKVAYPLRHWQPVLNSGLKLKQIIRGDIDIATHLKEMEPEIQASLDDLFNE